MCIGRYIYCDKQLESSGGFWGRGAGLRGPLKRFVVSRALRGPGGEVVRWADNE